MHQNNNALNDLCLPERNILVSDINAFLSTIVVHSIQTSGSNVQVRKTKIMFIHVLLSKIILYLYQLFSYITDIK